MKYYLSIIFLIITIAIATFFFINNKPRAGFSNDKLYKLIDTYGSNSPLVSEYFDMYKISKKKRNRIIALAKIENNQNYINKPKSKTYKNNLTKNENNITSQHFVVVDNIYTNNENNSTEKTNTKKSFANSTNNLIVLQKILDNVPDRSNDFLVKLDLNINGFEINPTDREARVSLNLLNSDLFESGIFSNAPGLWVTGLDKYKNPKTYEALWYDYKNRFIEIPGVGIYLMKNKLSDAAFATRKIKILNELINENPNDKLYEQLAKVYADSGDINSAEKTINFWAEKSENVNYEYEMAEIYRLNGEKSNDNNALQKAADYYEQSRNSPELTQKTALPLAKTYEKLGDINSAIRTLENSFDYGKNKIWKDKVAIKLGEYYAKTGDEYAAINWYEKSPVPSFVNKVRRAEAYQRLGNTFEAEKYYKSAIQMDDNANYIPMMSLGVLYSKNGKTDEAKKIYNKLNNRLQDFSKKRREQIKKSPEYQKIKNTIKH